uniref:Uncharacterized protein n=1 Tax=Glossina brevipalpis TaxID=37001 RepID=A0A1A9X239_9MUSC
MELISSNTDQTPNLDGCVAKISTTPQTETINLSKEEKQINIKALKSEEFGDLTYHALKEPPMLKQSVTQKSNMEDITASTNNAIVRKVSKNASNALQTCKAPTEVMPGGDLPNNMCECTKHPVRQLRKYPRSGLPLVDTKKFISKVNEVFLTSLIEIDHEDTCNIDLRMVTLQDWVKVLNKIIQFLIISVEKLGFDLAEQKRTQRWNNYCCRKESNELIKCHKDINSLLKVIQNVYYDNNWDIKDLSLETMSPSAIFGDIKKDFHPEKTQNADVLIVELVTKQEELESLKKQISFMENQKQNILEEIEVKDEVIKRLNSATLVAVPKSDVRSLLSYAIEFFSSKF